MMRPTVAGTPSVTTIRAIASGSTATTVTSRSLGTSQAGTGSRAVTTSASSQEVKVVMTAKIFCVPRRVLRRAPARRAGRPGAARVGVRLPQLGESGRNAIEQAVVAAAGVAAASDVRTKRDMRLSRYVS